MTKKKNCTIIATILLLATSSASMAETLSSSSILSLAGKTLSNERATVTLKEDGTLKGLLGKKAFSGTWKEEDGKYCRIIPAFKIDGCQDVIEVKDADNNVIGYEFRDPGESSGRKYYL